MPRLDSIHTRFRIAAVEAPASAEQVSELRRVSVIQVPDDYLAWVTEATEIEVRVDDGGHVRIWGPAGCVEMNAAYEIQQHIPNSLAIGDDEGGGALVYMSGGAGWGLYLVRFGDSDASEAVYLAPSLDAFLLDGVGPTVGA